MSKATFNSVKVAIHPSADTRGETVLNGLAFSYLQIALSREPKNSCEFNNCVILPSPSW